MAGNKNINVNGRRPMVAPTAAVSVFNKGACPLVNTIAPSKRRDKACLVSTIATIVAAAILLTCEKVPDYCGKGVWYNPEFQFCFGGEAYSLCGGNKKYNPLTEGCGKNAVGTRCADDNVVPPGTPCGGYTIAAAAAPADGGTIIRTPDERSYPAGELVVLSAISAEGYKFAGWAGAQESEKSTVMVTMDANKPLVAMFSRASAPGAATRILTTDAFSDNGGGTGGNITRNPDSPDYEPGTKVTITAEPAPNYTFAGWLGSTEPEEPAPTAKARKQKPAGRPKTFVSEQPAITVTINDDRTLVAMFKPVELKLTVSASPAASGAVFVNNAASTGTTTHNAETKVELWALAAAGYAFTEWTGSATGAANPITITMDEAKTITAKFQSGNSSNNNSGGETAPTMRKLTVHAYPEEGGAVTGGGEYKEGTKTAITAAPNEGYTFNGWTGEGVSDKNSPTAEADMAASRTVTANFKRTHIHYWGEWTTITPATCEAPGAETRTCQIDPGHTETRALAQLTGTDCYDDPDPCDANPGSPECCANNPNHPTCYIPPSEYTLATGATPTAGGSVTRNPNRGSYTHGTEVTVTAAANAGYTFTGWTGASAATTNSITITMDGNKTLTAAFTQNAYTLTTTNTTGGTVERDLNQATYPHGAQVTVTATPDEGYTFTGWTGASTSTTGSVAVTMDGSKTLTANFEPITGLTLTTGANPTAGGSVTRNPNQGNYTHGTSVIATAAPAEGYTFTRWAGASTSTSSSVAIIMDGNKTLTANFTQNTYTLTANANPIAGGTVTRNPSQTNYPHGTEVTVTAAANTGYTFTGWTGASTSTAAEITITMDGNKTLTAVFTQNTYTLTTPNVTGGSVGRNPDLTTYTHGTQVTVTASANTGYTFNRWSGASTAATNPVVITMDENKTLTASFTQNTYTLTVNANPTAGGSVGRNPNLTSYTHGAQVIVTATAAVADGYKFTGWSGASNATTNPITITMDSAKTLTANFTLNTYTLTVNASPTAGGSVGRNPNLTSYTHGTQVTVTASADIGYTFTGWSGASTTTTNPVVIIMDSAKTLTANFQLSMSGTFTDSRDFKTYKYVRIGPQIWMAENLNYAGSGSTGVCYRDSASYCAQYGRLYDWATVMGLPDSCNTKNCASQVPSPHRGICPAGWHVPSDAEWVALTSAVGGAPTAGTVLKSASGWYNNGNGTDAYGFSALPGGNGNGGVFYDAGNSGYWWSATEYGAGGAWSRGMYYSSEDVGRGSSYKAGRFSLRCSQD